MCIRDRSWAKELGKQGVRVVGVAPGIMEATGLRTIGYETALAYTRGITVEQLRAGYSKTSTIPPVSYTHLRCPERNDREDHREGI